MNRYLFMIGQCVLWGAVIVWVLIRFVAPALPEVTIERLLSRQLVYGIMGGAPLLVGVGVILIALAGSRAARTDERLTRQAVRYAVIASALFLGAWWHSLSLHGAHRASPFTFVPLLTFAGTAVGGLRLLIRHRLLEALLAYVLVVGAQFPWHFLYAEWWSQGIPVLPKVIASLLGFGWAVTLLGLAHSYRSALLQRGESPSVTT